MNAIQRIVDAMPGEWFTYHTGFLVIDREDAENWPGLDGAASVLAGRAALGEVQLRQRRIGRRGKGQFEYLARVVAQ